MSAVQACSVYHDTDCVQRKDTYFVYLDHLNFTDISTGIYGTFHIVTSVLVFGEGFVAVPDYFIPLPKCQSAWCKISNWWYRKLVIYLVINETRPTTDFKSIVLLKVESTILESPDRSKLHSENKHFKSCSLVVLQTALTKNEFHLFRSHHRDVVIS